MLTGGKRPTMPKIVIVSNTAWSLVNFRKGQIETLKRRGYSIIGAAGKDVHAHRLGDIGAKFVDLPFSVKSINPIADIRLFFSFLSLYRRERPTVVHHFTIKPVIYGSIAARLAGVPRIVNTITGLGFVFSEDAARWLRTIVEWQYRVGLSCAHYTFFQNTDDRQLFIGSGLISPKHAGLVPGSGVDITAFAPPEDGAADEKEDAVSFLMVSRLLRDKGIYEFVAAARKVRERYPNAKFLVAGRRDERFQGAVPLEDIDRWQDEGVVCWLGELKDIRGALVEADVVVLPSYYREGIPRALLEAAAMGKPVITTDNVGCRDVVDDGRSGLLVPVKDADALADAMCRMIEDPSMRQEMGMAGREKVVKEFDEAIVIRRTIDAYSLEAHAAVK